MQLFQLSLRDKAVSRRFPARSVSRLDPQVQHRLQGSIQLTIGRQTDEVRRFIFISTFALICVQTSEMRCADDERELSQIFRRRGINDRRASSRQSGNQFMRTRCGFRRRSVSAVCKARALVLCGHSGGGWRRLAFEPVMAVSTSLQRSA